MNFKDLISAAHQIAAEKNIEPEQVIEAIESALAAAYKKEYRKKTELIKAKLDPKTNELKFFLVKLVVDPQKVKMSSEEVKEKSETSEAEVIYNPDRHIFLEEAKKIKPDAEVGEELEFPLEAHENFGRIAAQTAKQVILQHLRESEREAIEKEFSEKEGEIISGIVQRFEHGNIYVDLGRTIGIMFQNESIPGEFYQPGQRLRFYVLAVQSDLRRPGIILSRSHPKFIAKLFEMEVPEIAEGIVEIKQIAREPGSRTKIAVASKDEKVDPVGSTVGQRGTRVMTVINELGNEKIDVIEWSEDPAKYIANALSPAKVKAVEILPRREAKVFVPDDQLSLAIGKNGQNVRLAAKLTGWKIDVRSQARPEEMPEGGVAEAPLETTEETFKETESEKLETSEEKETEEASE